MKNYPKITIITPTYNQGQYIEQTIQSVLNQNYPNLEYIIIDGGSTDKTIEIIKKYESQLAYWVSEPDNGQSHAINKGFIKATGNIFNWLNSDDYYEPGTLNNIGKHFYENPDTHILCGFTHCFYEETGETSHTYQMGVKKTIVDTILNVEMNQPGSFYRMDIIKELGGVNESLRYVFDDELWFKYLCKYGLKNIAFTDALFVHFRLHSDSKSINDGFPEFYKELQNIWYEIAQQLNLPDYILAEIKKELQINYYKTAKWNFQTQVKEQILAHYYNKYQYTLYENFKYKEAEESIKYLLKQKKAKFDKKFISLFIKLFVVNRKLLILLRKKL